MGVAGRGYVLCKLIIGPTLGIVREQYYVNMVGSFVEDDAHYFICKFVKSERDEGSSS